MLDVKRKIDHCNLFLNSTRIVSFFYKTEGMSSIQLSIYSILELCSTHYCRDAHL